MLKSDLESGVLSLYREEVSAEEAYGFYSQKPEFSIVCFNQFREKLASHRRSILKQLDRSKVEEEAMLHDREMHPVEMHSAQGIIRYDISATKLSLREDVMAGKHFTMTAAALRASRPEYQQEYNNQKFQEHLRKEVRYQKFVNYLNDKREEEEKKKQEALEKAKAERPMIKAKQQDDQKKLEAERNGKRTRKP